MIKQLGAPHPKGTSIFPMNFRSKVNPPFFYHHFLCNFCGRTGEEEQESHGKQTESLQLLCCTRLVDILIVEARFMKGGTVDG